MRKMKRLSSMLLILCMVLGICPVTVQAANNFERSYILGDYGATFECTYTSTATGVYAIEVSGLPENVGNSAIWLTTQSGNKLIDRWYYADMAEFVYLREGEVVTYTHEKVWSEEGNHTLKIMPVDVSTLTMDGNVSVETESGWNYDYFWFTPRETGFYTFMSSQSLYGCLLSPMLVTESRSLMFLDNCIGQMGTEEYLIGGKTYCVGVMELNDRGSSGIISVNKTVIPTLTEGTTLSVLLPAMGDLYPSGRHVAFIPAKTGQYTFRFDFDETDPVLGGSYGYGIYDSKMEYIEAERTTSYENGTLDVVLKGGETYNLDVWYASGGTCKISVDYSADAAVNAKVVALLPANGTADFGKASGLSNWKVEFDQLAVTFDKVIKTYSSTDYSAMLDFSKGSVSIYRANDDALIWQAEENYGKLGTSPELTVDSTTKSLVIKPLNRHSMLDYSTEYYVVIDKGVIRFADGTVNNAIKKGNWSFSTISELEMAAQDRAIVEGKFNYISNITKMQESYGFYYDDAWFFKSSSEKNYNHDLVKMSIRMAMAAAQTHPTNIKYLYDKLSISYTEASINYPTPNENSIGYAIGSKNIKYDDEIISLIAVSVRGGGYETEWAGNLMLGSGEHHEGFYFAAMKVLDGIDDYIAEHKDQLSPNLKVWITGFSRAAAVSNLVAKKLDDGEIDSVSAEDVFAFCFECPQNSRSSDVNDSQYNNIVNVVNPIDFVPKLAMSDWGYGRYGVTYCIPSREESAQYYILKNRMIKEYEDIISQYALEHDSAIEYTKETYGQASEFDELAENLAAGFVSTENYRNNSESKMMDIAAKYLGKQDREIDFGRLFNEVVALLRHPIDLVETVSIFMQGCGGQAHYPELCLAWIDSLEGKSAYTDGTYRKIYVNCPVNIKVYDSGGALVGRVDDVLEEMDQGIVTYVDQYGQKVLILPTDEEYTIELTASDDGTVTYTATEYDSVSGNTKKVVSYREIDIAEGDQLVGTVENLEDVTVASYPLTYNSEQMTADIDEKEDDVTEYEVSCKVEGDGTVNYLANAVYGEYRKFTATPDGGAEFIGWYDGDTLLSTQSEYRSCIIKDTTLTAKFTEVEEPKENHWWGGSSRLNDKQNESMNEPFVDVIPSDWFYDAVVYVYENGLMNGIGDTRFGPNTTITRGMLVTILHRLAGQPKAGTCDFADVSANVYYADAVTWAAENTIVEGYGNGIFGPDDAITREQLAVILYRYAQYEGHSVSVDNTAARAFADAGQISQWAVPALQWACDEGLLSGMGHNLLNPQGSATRAQTAVILMRLCENRA